MSADDLYVIPIRLFTLVVVMGFVLVLISQFTTVFTNIGDPSSLLWLDGTTSIVKNRIDTFFIVEIISLFIISLIAATRLPKSVMWAPFFAIATLLGVWFSYPISQAYTALIETTAFAEQSSYMQITALTMQRLPLLILIMGCTLGLVTYMKFREERMPDIRST